MKNLSPDNALSNYVQDCDNVLYVDTENGIIQELDDPGTCGDPEVSRKLEEINSIHGRCA